MPSSTFAGAHKLNCAYASGQRVGTYASHSYLSLCVRETTSKKVNKLSRELPRKMEFWSRHSAAFKLGHYSHRHTHTHMRRRPNARSRKCAGWRFRSSRSHVAAKHHLCISVHTECAQERRFTWELNSNRIGVVVIFAAEQQPGAVRWIKWMPLQRIKCKEWE